MKTLARELVFGQNKKSVLEKIKKIAKERGIFLNSTQKLYEKIVQGEIKGFTTPAFNLRTLTFDFSRALFRAVKKQKTGAFIIELAKSEMDYTSQSLDEYLGCVLAGAVEENFKGMIFLQGDHFRISKEGYFSVQKEFELRNLENLIKNAVQTGFYNIDIDCSPLILEGGQTVFEKQKENFLMTARFTDFIRRIEPKNLTVSIGGEVGIIGGKNTTVEELNVFMEGFRKEISRYKIKKGLIKIAVQTGTSHGGILLPSGELKVMEEDFKTLKELSETARKYSMAGAVQHGASTLPEKYFKRFPETGCCEIHLATVFQNIFYDSDYFPQFLKEEIYENLKKEYPRKETENEIQFLYRNRKRAFGKFKKEIWSLPQKNIDGICEEIEEKFIFFFKALNVSGTKDLITRIYEC